MQNFLQVGLKSKYLPPRIQTKLFSLNLYINILIVFMICIQSDGFKTIYVLPHAFSCFVTRSYSIYRERNE